MLKQDRSKEEIRRDLLAFSTQGLFVMPFIFSGIYGTYKVWLYLSATKPDDAITIPAALLFGLVVILGVFVSGTLGELLWVVVMRSFLRRAELAKWLNSGLTSPSIKRWNAKLLDWAYKSEN